MSIQNTILISDLQYYFAKLIIDSKLNFNQAFAPSSSYVVDPNSRSIIRLLFDNEWPPDFSFYFPLFREASITECPLMLRQRLMLYPSTAKYYLADSTDCTINFLNLQTDDYHLLYALLEYKTQGTHYQFDSYNFENLETTLSKLIFIFLDLKVNYRNIYYNNDETLADPGNLLENCFEFYVQESIFDFYSSIGV